MVLGAHEHEVQLLPWGPGSTGAQPGTEPARGGACAHPRTLAKGPDDSKRDFQECSVALAVGAQTTRKTKRTTADKTTEQRSGKAVHRHVPLQWRHSTAADGNPRTHKLAWRACLRLVSQVARQPAIHLPE